MYAQREKLEAFNKELEILKEEQPNRDEKYINWKYKLEGINRINDTENGSEPKPGR